MAADYSELADMIAVAIGARRSEVSARRARVRALLVDLDDDPMIAAAVSGRHVPGTPYEYSHGWVRTGMRPPGDADRAELKSRGIKIPSGWTDVQVSVDPHADLQVIGKDSKGRSQYVYSAEHSARQSAAKFARIRMMRDKMPAIDGALARDARTEDAAAALLLIRRMGLRPGSDSDTGAEKKAYGATNLLAGQVSVSGDVVRFRFTGKKGVELDLEIDDPDVAKVIEPRLSGKAPGERLFVTNEKKTAGYLKRIDPSVKLKDLRTYRGTDIAGQLVAGTDAPVNRKTYKAAVNNVALMVSQALGNTPSVALESYIDPSVFSPWRFAADIR
ncbi:MAG: hypothetical protein ACRDTT_31440 [Pseudonocardiaceae bacterium]